MRASKSVCLSADTTTASNKHQFLGITATILRDGQIKTVILGLCDIFGVPHTGSMLSNMLEPYCDELKKCGFVTIVTDSGSNMVKATNEQKWAHLNIRYAHRCTCHALHNSLVKFLPFEGDKKDETKPSTQLGDLLKKCRQFAYDVSTSTDLTLQQHEL